MLTVLLPLASLVMTFAILYSAQRRHVARCATRPIGELSDWDLAHGLPNGAYGQRVSMQVAQLRRKVRLGELEVWGFEHELTMLLAPKQKSDERCWEAEADMEPTPRRRALYAREELALRTPARLHSRDRLRQIAEAPARPDLHGDDAVFYHDNPLVKPARLPIGLRQVAEDLYGGTDYLPGQEPPPPQFVRIRG